MVSANFVDFLNSLRCSDDEACTLSKLLALVRFVVEANRRSVAIAQWSVVTRKRYSLDAVSQSVSILRTMIVFRLKVRMSFRNKPSIQKDLKLCDLLCLFWAHA